MKEHPQYVATFLNKTVANVTAGMFEDLTTRFFWHADRFDGKPWQPNKDTVARLDMAGVSPIRRFKPVVSNVMRAFVCITGQLERLELRSKI
jgi:hypothetical protein